MGSIFERQLWFQRKGIHVVENVMVFRSAGIEMCPEVEMLAGNGQVWAMEGLVLIFVYE
jgi:hypothetical protein